MLQLEIVHRFDKGLEQSIELPWAKETPQVAAAEAPVTVAAEGEKGATSALTDHQEHPGLRAAVTSSRAMSLTLWDRTSPTALSRHKNSLLSMWAADQVRMEE